MSNCYNLFSVKIFIIRYLWQICIKYQRSKERLIEILKNFNNVSAHDNKNQFIYK